MINDRIFMIVLMVSLPCAAQAGEPYCWLDDLMQRREVPPEQSPPDVRGSPLPVLDRYCIDCHGEKKPADGLTLIGTPLAFMPTYNPKQGRRLQMRQLLDPIPSRTIHEQSLNEVRREANTYPLRRLS